MGVDNAKWNQNSGLSYKVSPKFKGSRFYLLSVERTQPCAHKASPLLSYTPTPHTALKHCQGKLNLPSGWSWTLCSGFLASKENISVWENRGSRLPSRKQEELGAGGGRGRSLWSQHFWGRGGQSVSSRPTWSTEWGWAKTTQRNLSLKNKNRNVRRQCNFFSGFLGVDVWRLSKFPTITLVQEGKKKQFPSQQRGKPMDLKEH